VSDRAALLKLMVADGKPVFAVEYLDDKPRIDAARMRLIGYGFVPHFGDRLLGSMRVGDYPVAAATPVTGKSWRRSQGASSQSDRPPTSFERWKTYGLPAAIAAVGLFALLRRARSRRQ
jgi:hypothetical protein